MNKPIQYFTEEYILECAKMTPLQRLEFLENYRILYFANQRESKKKSTLISLKVESTLLSTFKQAATLRGKKYQTLIKELMQDWVKKSHP